MCQNINSLYSWLGHLLFHVDVALLLIKDVLSLGNAFGELVHGSDWVLSNRGLMAEHDGVDTIEAYSRDFSHFFSLGLLAADH